MPSVVLIPGLLCNEALWASQSAALGKSADITIPDITKQSTIEQMAAAILERAPKSFCLAGFSLGSQVALEIARTAADRVEKLALLSATHGGLPPAVQLAIQDAIATIEQGNFDQYLDAAYPTYFAPRHANDPVLKRCFVEMAHAVGADAGVRQMRALLAISGPFTGLNQIACPTVIVGGREDHRTTPAAHYALAHEIRGSQLVLVDDAAHFTPLEQPDVVTAVLQRWLVA